MGFACWLESPFVAADLFQEVAQVGRELLIGETESAEQHRSGGGGICAAGFHRSDLDEATVVALAIKNELTEPVRLRWFAIEQLVGHHGQERVVGAADRSLGRLRVAAVGGAHAFELRGNLIRPIGRLVGQQVGTAECLRDERGVQPTDEVHDVQRTPIERADEPADLFRLVRRQATQYRETAHGETGVVQVGVSLAALEATVSLLS